MRQSTNGGAIVGLELDEAIRVSVVKSAPPVAVAVGAVTEMGLQDWVYVLTIVYTVLLILHHCYTKIWRPWRERKAFRNDFEMPRE